MDRLASVLLAFPLQGDGTTASSNEQYDRAIKAHLTALAKLGKEQQLVAAHAHALLQHVDPAVNSLSYLWLLQHLYESDGKNTQLPEDLHERLLIFLLTFDGRQIRYAGSTLDRFLVGLEAGTLLPPLAAVSALTSTILRIDPTSSVFTSHHLGLAKLAYTSGNLEAALPVITKPIVFYPNASSLKDPTVESRYLCDPQLSPLLYITRETGLTGPVKAIHVLEYDALCGQIYTQLRDWQRAFDAFERVISHPSRDGGITRLTAEAYGRWILVGLLLRGRTPSSAGIVPQGLAKQLQTLAKPYIEVAKAFEERNAENLRTEVQNLTQFLTEEGTTGLMTEVVAAFQRWQILDLRAVYSKISLAEIRRRTRSGETGESVTSDDGLRTLLQSMVASGMLKGVVEQDASAGQLHLTFLPEAEDLSEVQFAAEIQATARRIKALEPVVKATNERLTTSKDYVRWMVRQQKLDKENAQRGPGGGGSGPADLFESQIEDEDLMTGVSAD